MQYLLCLAYLSLFVFLIYRLKFFDVPGLSRKSLAFIFLLKLLAGFLLYAVFTWFYKDRPNSDIFKFYDDSKHMYDALFVNPLDYFKMLTGIGNNTPHFTRYYDQMFNWYRKLNSNLYNESHFIIRFNALLRLFSFGVYFVHVIFICFMSTAGLTGMYRFFSNTLNGKNRILTVCLFLTPSVFLWTSGLIKEAFIVSFLGIVLSALKEALEKRRVLFSFLVILLGLILLLCIKIYILVAFIPTVLAYVWSYEKKMQTVFIRYGVVIFALIGMAFLVRGLFPDYDPAEVIRIKQADFILISEKADSRIEIPPLEASFRSLLRNAPNALFNSLCRPLKFHGHAFIRMAAIENWLLLLFAAWCLLFSRPLHQVNWNVVLMCLLFSLILLLIVGWITPVVGAIVRYKVPALPFMLAGLLHLKRS